PSDPVVLANLSAIANSMSAKAVPLLISIAKTGSPKGRRDATFWLARSHADRDLIVSTLLEILSTPQDPDVESAASSALAEINTPRALTALADTVRDKSRSLAARRSALNAVGRSNAPNQLSMLEDLYRNTADTVELRRTIVSYIGRINEPRTVTVLAA